MSFLTPEDTGTSWAGHVRNSPTRWPTANGQAVVDGSDVVPEIAVLQEY
jgi:hypothetical protein